MKAFTIIIALLLLTNIGLFAQSGMTIKSGGAVTVNGNTAIIPNSFSIGQSYGGGIIFYVTPDGQHGLIAETQDQSIHSSWYDAYDIICDPNNHSIAGKNYTDWRLPSKYELNLLYVNKDIIGGFFLNSMYWSSTEYYGINNNNAWDQLFLNGQQTHGNAKCCSLESVRAIRSF